MAQIFLSYAHEDLQTANTLASALNMQGWTVWWDRTIPPGEIFDEVIEKQLGAAKRVIVLWSRMSVESKWIKIEATEAKERGVLFPVLIQKVRIPLAFKLITAADLTKWEGDPADRHFEAFCKLLRQQVPPSRKRTVNVGVEEIRRVKATLTPRLAPAESAQLEHLFDEAVQSLEREDQPSDVMVSVQNQEASLLQSGLALKASEAKTAKFGGKFNAMDPGWLLVALSSLIKGLKRHSFLVASPEPEPLPDVARVALLGSWGTGLYGAPVCAQSIAADRRGYQLVLHLGDIYYSGTEAEVKDRFLALWPKVGGAVSRALNGNHEMYSGGNGYFSLVLPAFGQRASYFACQNNDWTLVGLDTAYENHDIRGEQLLWLGRIVEQAGERKVVLFTHHQPYSLLEEQGPKLVSRLGQLLADKRIFAWYWGHELRCVLYEPHPLWGFHGRCVGNSGVPSFRPKVGPCPLTPRFKSLPGKNYVPPGEILDGPNPYIRGHETAYGPHGYVTLEFRGSQLTEIVRLADGDVVRTKELS